MFINKISCIACISILAVNNFANVAGKSDSLKIEYFAERFASSSKRHPVDNQEINFDVGITYRIFCTSPRNFELFLRWEVQPYELQSNLNQDNTIEIAIEPYENLKISCIGSLYSSPKIEYREHVTFRKNEGYSKHNADIKPDIQEVAEGDDLTSITGYHCILDCRKYGFINSNILIHNITKSDNNCLRYCASIKKFEGHKNKLYLDTKETFIKVIPKPTRDDDNNEKYNKNDESNTGSPFPVKELVGGIITFITIVVISIIVYRLRRKRSQKRIEHIYAEPEVLYAEIEADQEGPTPQTENTPYATIIGIVKQKPLPPRNENTSKRDGIRPEQNTVKVVDLQINVNYSEIQRQN